MTVLLPYTPDRLEQRTSEWAYERGDVLAVNVSGADDAYYRLLVAQWREPGDLLVVEHDMLPADGSVDEMLACRWGWCTAPYNIANGQQITDGLGVAKFSATLKALRPQLMDEVGALADDGLPPRDWRRLDTRISRILRAAGHQPHLHAPALHLHDYQSRP